jgi:hypothetical protein
MRRPSKYSGQYVLAQLPDDLQARSWEWVKFESKPVMTRTGTWYQAVYVRPFDRDLDDERAVDVVQYSSQWCVRVTTQGAHSGSWEAAHRDAIALMRDADARRTSTQT